MSDRSPRITISIVTLDRRDLLEMCLWYLYETTTDAERDLWIWDNGSVDDTPDFLGTLVGWPGVRVFRSPINEGGIPPRRRLLPHVRTPYLFTLDDDMCMITKGWATAIADVLDAGPTICQLAVPQGYVHETSDYGISHTRLAAPFFRVPLIRPQSKIALYPVGDKSEPHFLGARTEADYDVQTVGGQRVALPPVGTQLPFPCPGGCSAWRVGEIRSVLESQRERHHTEDLRAAWSFPLQERGGREAMILDHGLWHVSPAPLWYMGRGERYWEHRAQIAEVVYLRSAETQRGWLRSAREASGWSAPLEDPDTALR